jgi:hypothetical protein
MLSESEQVNPGHALLQKARDIIDLVLIDDKPNCLNCVSWKDDEEICGIYNKKPPLKTIIHSCSIDGMNNWKRGIPF